MASIHNFNQNTNLLLNKAPDSKRNAEGNKSQQGRHSKGSQSFQALLDKPKGESKPSVRKEGAGAENGRSDDKKQGQERKENTGRSVEGDIGTASPSYNKIEGTENSDFLIGTSKDDFINGKNGNDFVFGGRGHDVVFGGGGNDLIFGGKGNDTLYSGEGNDLVFGGKGNDTVDGGNGNDLLLGGKGEDRISGGQGNDRLYGGAGDDILSDNLGGNNYINGGRGSDTLNLNQDVDAYNISINNQGDFVIETKQNEQVYDPFAKGGQSGIPDRADNPFKNTVRNVEYFQFGNTKISAEQLRDRVENPPQDLSLTEPEKTAVESVFNINNASVSDENADGKISEGDTVSGTLFRETGTIDVSYEVSKDNADHINGDLGSDLQLSPEKLDQVDKVVNPFNMFPHDSPVPLSTDVSARGVLDSDGSGGLSVGDVVYSRSNQITTGGDPIGGSPTYHRLTEGDIQSLNSEPLVLTGDQDSGIRERFDIGSGSTYRVLDKDGNKQLGAGDVLEITVGGDAITNVELTKEDVAAINSNRFPQDKPLVLTGDQDGAIRQRFDITNAEYEVVDVDNSGSLTVGDEVHAGGEDGEKILRVFKLTAEDIAAINGNGFPQELNLTGEQHEAIGARFNQLPPPNLADGVTTEYTGVAIDNDNDGKLSEGDVVRLKQTGGYVYYSPDKVDTNSQGDFGHVIDHILTADDISAIEKDRSDPLLDISKGLSESQKSRMFDAFYALDGDIGFGSYPVIESVFDHNSDEKISVGDTLTISQFNETTGTTSLSFHTISQNLLDRYLAG